MVAALKGNAGIMKALRAKNAAVDGKGWTPLIYAATGGHDDLVRWLLGEGADINAQSPNGTTALMMAVRENKYSTALLLIARGANVNHRNENGASALDWAKRNDDTVMVERLRNAGAGTDDYFGTSAIVDASALGIMPGSTPTRRRAPSKCLRQ
jgi:ankyrin repeat protein